MHDRREAGGLRAARAARGWSQSEAARELAALGHARGAPVAAATSLKSLLSRWENGHAVPEPQYRALLSELYERTPAELGVAGPPTGAGGADGADPADPDAAAARLRAALAAAAAVDDTTTQLWREQLRLAARLDDELGAAGAGALLQALVERLDETVRHALGPAHRSAAAALLAPAALLAGAQELDRGRPDLAWRRYDQAAAAAVEANRPDLAADALAGQAGVLVDIGDATAALTLLDAAGPALPTAVRPRIAGARADAAAVLGDATAARQAITDAATATDAAATTDTGNADATGELARPDATRTPVPVELADLDRWHGHALTILGDTAAAHPLHRALAAPPRSVRHRAALHADIALTLATERPEDASEHARTARQLALRIGSTRIPRALGALAVPAPAGPAPGSPTTRDPRDDDRPPG